MLDKRTYRVRRCEIRIEPYHQVPSSHLLPFRHARRLPAACTLKVRSRECGLIPIRRHVSSRYQHLPWFIQVLVNIDNCTRNKRKTIDVCGEDTSFWIDTNSIQRTFRQFFASPFYNKRIGLGLLVSAWNESELQATNTHLE